MTNQLMTNENYMTTYTKPQLIEILEAKATIYIDFYYTSRNFTWVTLRDALPTGYKRLTKAEIVDEIQFYNKVLGVNKAKAEPTATKRTVKLNRKAFNNMKLWKQLQQYLQNNDRHGEWLSMPPTRENVIYVLDVLERWEDDSAWSSYLVQLLKEKRTLRKTKWGVMHLDAQGNLDHDHNFYEFTAYNPLKFIKKGIGRSHDFSTGFAINVYPYDEGSWTKFN